jgi:hypothetical protein
MGAPRNPARQSLGRDVVRSSVSLGCRKGDVIRVLDDVCRGMRSDGDEYFDSGTGGCVSVLRV